MKVNKLLGNLHNIAICVGKVVSLKFFVVLSLVILLYGLIDFGMLSKVLLVCFLIILVVLFCIGYKITNIVINEQYKDVN